MVRWTGGLLLSAALGLAAAPASGAPAAEPRFGPCRAESVLDGNTAELRCGVELVRVRLLRVDAPRAGETGHDEATRALRALLRGRELFLAFETPGRPGFDRDASLLVFLYDGAGQNMNVAMVALGWASYAAVEDGEPLERSFRLAEHEARAAQRAMWSVWAYTVGRGGPRDAPER